MTSEALYRLQGDAPELIWLDVRQIDQKHLLTALAQALLWPDYFGHNWDAAWDCLSDPDLMRSVARLGLRITEAMQINQQDLETFLEIIEEAAVLWHEHDALLQVFISHQRDDLERLEPIPVWS